MKIVSVINYKGGVGKTTLTANLAAWLASRGKKVLMLDIDPQSSLTFSFVGPAYWQEHLAKSATIKNWYDSLVRGVPVPFGSLLREPPQVKKKLPRGCLHLIASHLELLEVDLFLSNQLSSINPEQLRENQLRVYSYLHNALVEFSAGQFDYTLIDCPPSFSLVTKNAIIASDYLLCPTRPDHISTLGVSYLRDRVDRLVKDYNTLCVREGISRINPRWLGIVFTMIEYHDGEPIKAHREAIGQLQHHLRDWPEAHYFEPYVRHNSTKFSAAPEHQVPVILTSDTSDTGKKILAELQALMSNIELRLNGVISNGQPRSTTRQTPVSLGSSNRTTVAR